MEPLHAGLLGFGAGLVVFLLVLWLIAGFDGKRLSLGCRVLRDAELTAKVTSLLEPPGPSGPPRPSGVPVRLLALLQRDGRLVDFLLEEIQGATDAQIAAAMRDLHPKCRETLNKHLVLAPVLAQQEGSSVEVPAGFDPSAIHLVGNVSGNPPFRGTLRHPGWRVGEIKLPPLPEGQDDLVLMPAEVEIV